MSKSFVVSLFMCGVLGLPGVRPALGDDPSPWPKFDDVTKGMESHSGLFTLWYYPASAKDKDTEKLLCQIPSSFLGQKFMLSTSQAGGGYDTGFPIDEVVVKWEQQDRQLVLVAPQTGFVVNDKSTVSDVVRRTYPDTIRAAVPIVTKSSSGDPVIDFGALLKGNLASVAVRGINPGLSKWANKKAFDLNVEITVELAVPQYSPPGSYGKRILHFSFWKLPATDYKPRVADDRVGYFLTANQDWSKPNDARDLFNRYIDRWHLVKRDPTLAKCEPREPIVYYVEKTVPVRYRQAVREGILEWNKAFEKLGFVDAVQVRQQTEDNEWKDLDPEDMRYSFLRWIVTGGGFAMGPHRANPFTGQIYDADIVFDDSMVRIYESQLHQMTPSTLAEEKWDEPAMKAFIQSYPDLLRPVHNWEDVVIGEQRPSLDSPAGERMMRQGFRECDYARGMMHQLALAQGILADQPQEVIDRLLYDTIKQTTTHEVGHTLGLRHNFKGSTIYTLEEIRNRRKTGQATSGSVMDYLPVLFTVENTTEGHFTTPTIGPYDYWAIEYGYRLADGKYKPPAKAAEEKKADKGKDASENAAAADKQDDKDKKDDKDQKDKQESKDEKGPKGGKEQKKAAPKPASGEEAMLEAIASRCTEPELAYATDEDTTAMSPDPRSNRFDLGADPIDWAKDRMALVDKRMADLLEWGAKDGESWYYARIAFSHLIAEKAQVLDYVGRYIGGQYTSRSHRGDPDAKPPFELVDLKTQRRAMDFVEETLFSDSFFAVPPKVLNYLAVPRWDHEGARINLTQDFPIHEMISTLQWRNLSERLLPNTLRRIQDAEMKAEGDDQLTVAEYLQRLQRACWADSVSLSRRNSGKWSEQKPFIADVRRSLQREYLGVVEPLVRMKPGLVLSPDLHGMLQYLLTDLSKQIDALLKQPGPTLDFASAAHLTTCKSRIDRILSAPLEENARGGFSIMLMGQTPGQPPQAVPSTQPAVFESGFAPRLDR
jgi:hypothetical protein